VERKVSSKQHRRPSRSPRKQLHSTTQKDSLEFDVCYPGYSSPHFAVYSRVLLICPRSLLAIAGWGRGLWNERCRASNIGAPLEVPGNSSIRRRRRTLNRSGARLGNFLILGDDHLIATRRQRKGRFIGQMTRPYRVQLCG
jgi:hypothetical protein